MFETFIMIKQIKSHCLEIILVFDVEHISWFSSQRSMTKNVSIALKFNPSIINPWWWDGGTRRVVSHLCGHSATVNGVCFPSWGGCDAKQFCNLAVPAGEETLSEPRVGVGRKYVLQCVVVRAWCSLGCSVADYHGLDVVCCRPAPPYLDTRTRDTIMAFFALFIFCRRHKESVKVC